MISFELEPAEESRGVEHVGRFRALSRGGLLIEVRGLKSRSILKVVRPEIQAHYCCPKPLLLNQRSKIGGSKWVRKACMELTVRPVIYFENQRYRCLRN